MDKQISTGHIPVGSVKLPTDSGSELCKLVTTSQQKEDFKDLSQLILFWQETGEWKLITIISKLNLSIEIWKQLHLRQVPFIYFIKAIYSVAKSELICTSNKFSL